MSVKSTLICFLYLFLACPLYAADYYLDAISGDDTNGDGSQGSPWQTLSKAQAVMASGDNFYLSGGDYGSWSETDHSARTDWVTFQAIDGEIAHLDNIYISNSTTTDAYLKFVGIEILPDDVDQTVDPQLSTSTQSTYNKTSVPVSLSNVNYLQIENSTISGRNHWLTTAGIYATSVSNVTISGCDIKTMWHAVRWISGGSNITVKGCHIHDITGTGINTVGIDYSNMLYENNHIHDGVHSYTEDYAPKADGADIHGSGISIRDGNTTARGNIIHNTGSSSGIMLYEDDVGKDYVNENVTIENNLLYDMGSFYGIVVCEAGANVVIRNNTVIARSRFDVNGGDAQFRTAFTLRSVDEQNGPADVQLHNNILLGLSSITQSAITESGNIIWGSSLCTGDPALSDSTIVLTCSYSDYPWDDLHTLFPNINEDHEIAFELDHGEYRDFTIDGNSQAYNNGVVAEQATGSLGTLDASNEFVVDNGVTRSSSIHSAGAYELGTEAANIKISIRAVGAAVGIGTGTPVTVQQ